MGKIEWINKEVSITLHDSNRITILVESKHEIAGTILTKRDAQKLVEELTLMIEKM